jgi:hypothetical protein
MLTVSRVHALTQTSNRKNLSFRATQKAEMTTERAPDISLDGARRRIQGVVEMMAGEPDDFVKRAVHMAGVAMDTRMQHLFPAIWANASLKIGPWFVLPKGFLSNILPLFARNSQSFQAGKQKLHQLSQQLCETNRDIFTQLMTQYYFLKYCGQHPEAWKFIHHKQPQALHALYQKLFEGQHLSPDEKQMLYEADLTLEQEHVVEPQIQKLSQALDWPLIQRLLKRPIIRLPFFPPRTQIRFKDFFDLADRMRCGMKALDLARQTAEHDIQKGIYTALVHHFNIRKRGASSPQEIIQAAHRQTRQKLEQCLEVSNQNGKPIKPDR